MGVLHGIMFDCFCRTTIRIALAQDWIDRAAFDGVIAGANFGLCVGCGLFGVLGQPIALGLQLGNCADQLWR